MPRCDAPLLRESRRQIREKRAESFRHGRMRENGVVQPSIWQARQHSGLDVKPWLLVATEAAGEGINLQVCNILFKLRYPVEPKPP
jgi:hypothetical protein